MNPAQATFSQWLKESLAPALRGHGFKGTGHTYSLPDEQCWILLGVQKSTSSTSENCRFTINLSVANKALWHELREWQHYWLAAKPSANSFSPGQAWTRIGSILPTGEDTWWDLRAGATDAERDALRREVETAIHDHGLPELRRLVAENRDSKVQDRINKIERIRPRPAHLK